MAYCRALESETAWLLVVNNHFKNFIVIHTINTRSKNTEIEQHKNLSSLTIRQVLVKKWHGNIQLGFEKTTAIYSNREKHP